MKEEEIEVQAEEYVLNVPDTVGAKHSVYSEEKLKQAYIDGLAEGRKETTEKISIVEKENAELKQILYKLVNAFNDYECAGPEQEQENTWEILRDLMHEELFKLTTRNK